MLSIILIESLHEYLCSAFQLCKRVDIPYKEDSAWWTVVGSQFASLCSSTRGKQTNVVMKWIFSFWGIRSNHLSVMLVISFSSKFVCKFIHCLFFFSLLTLLRTSVFGGRGTSWRTSIGAQPYPPHSLLTRIMSCTRLSDIYSNTKPFFPTVRLDGFEFVVFGMDKEMR